MTLSNVIGSGSDYSPKHCAGQEWTGNRRDAIVFTHKKTNLARALNAVECRRHRRGLYWLHVFEIHVKLEP